MRLMKRIKELIFNKEVILYLVFGVLTTLVNWVAYYGFNKLLNEILLANFFAWIVAVAFAYITNKLFVFESKGVRGAALIKEIGGFIGARIFSFIIEEGGMWIVKHFGWTKLLFRVWKIDITQDLIAKILLAVIVVIMNYFFSKLLIFTKKQK